MWDRRRGPSLLRAAAGHVWGCDDGALVVCRRVTALANRGRREARARPGAATPVLFNTLDYAAFFAASFAVAWLLARFANAWARIDFLLVASYAF